MSRSKEGQVLTWLYKLDLDSVTSPLNRRRASSSLCSISMACAGSVPRKCRYKPCSRYRLNNLGYPMSNSTTNNSFLSDVSTQCLSTRTDSMSVGRPVPQPRPFLRQWNGQTFLGCKYRNGYRRIQDLSCNNVRCLWDTNCHDVHRCHNLHNYRPGDRHHLFLRRHRIQSGWN